MPRNAPTRLGWYGVRTNGAASRCLALCFPTEDVFHCEVHETDDRPPVVRRVDDPYFFEADWAGPYDSRDAALAAIRVEAPDDDGSPPNGRPHGGSTR